MTGRGVINICRIHKVNRICLQSKPHNRGTWNSECVGSILLIKGPIHFRYFVKAGGGGGGGLFNKVLHAIHIYTCMYIFPTEKTRGSFSRVHMPHTCTAEVGTKVYSAT